MVAEKSSFLSRGYNTVLALIFDYIVRLLGYMAAESVDPGYPR